MSDADVKSLAEIPEWIETARRRLAGERFARLGYVAQTGSTNADLVGAAARGEPEQVLVADFQHAGRGRLDRRWEAPRGTNLLVSVLVRPRTGPENWPLLTTAMALAVIDAAGTGRIRWPNDVMVGDDKLAGVLAEAAGPAAVVGVGVNVGWPLGARDAPGLAATSLRRLGDRRSRGEVLSELVAAFGGWVHRLETEPALVSRAHRLCSATVGSDVRVDLGAGRIVEGRAVEITDEGCIVVLHDGRSKSYRAGDVTHLRQR